MKKLFFIFIILAITNSTAFSADTTSIELFETRGTSTRLLNGEPLSSQDRMTNSSFIHFKGDRAIWQSGDHTMGGICINTIPGQTTFVFIYPKSTWLITYYPDEHFAFLARQMRTSFSNEPDHLTLNAKVRVVDSHN